MFRQPCGPALLPSRQRETGGGIIMQIMCICNVMSAGMLNAAVERANVLATLLVKTTSSGVHACVPGFSRLSGYSSTFSTAQQLSNSCLRAPKNKKGHTCSASLSSLPYRPLFCAPTAVCIYNNARKTAGTWTVTVALLLGGENLGDLRLR